MKKLKNLLITGTLLAGLFATATSYAGTHYLWSTTPADTLWSNSANWSPVGVPGVNDNVTFTNGGDAGNPIALSGAVNNVVDAAFLTSINSLGYQVTNAYHNTQINGQLNVIGTSATDVAVITTDGEPYVFFVGDNNWQDGKDDLAWATMIGNSLTVSNVNANFGVTQISSVAGAHKALLDLTNVNTFTCVVSNFLVGHNFTIYDHAWRPTGEIWLAKTNAITTQLITVGDAYQNSGPDCYIHLGGVNTINTDTIGLGMHKNIGHMDTASGFANPSVTFRNTAGTGRQVAWKLGDGYDPTPAGTTVTQYGTNYTFGFFFSGQARGFMDLTGATVDALVDEIVLGRGQIQWDATVRNGDGNGTLIFSKGTIDVNNMQLGIQVAGPFIGGSVGHATLVVGDAGGGSGPALLNVRTNVTMAVVQPGNTDTALSTADITINDGSTMNVAGDMISGGGIVNITINAGGKLDLKPSGDTTAGSLSANTLTLNDGSVVNYNTLSNVTAINMTGGSSLFTVNPGQTITVGPVKQIATNNVTGSIKLDGSTILMDIGKSGATLLNDAVVTSGDITLGGTLKVTYAGSSILGPHSDLQVGDQFTLFSAGGTLSGSFTSVILPPPGAGLAWQNNTAADGSIQVVACGCSEPTTPPTITMTPTSPTTATLSWPLSYTTFALRAQTNAPGASITSNWGGLVPGVVGNSVSVPLNPANGSVFYELIQQ